MQRLSRNMHAALVANWKDHATSPEEPGTVAYDVFYDVVGELSNSFDPSTFSSLSTAQQQVVSMMSFSGAIPFDGLVVGIVCNQPEVIEPAQRAAMAHKLKHSTNLFNKLSKAVPSSVIELDPDARYEWTQTDQANALQELEDSELLEDARGELMLAAMRIVVKDPNEFAEAS